MAAWLTWLAAEWRFGRATKMERAGRLPEAFALYSKGRARLATAQSDDPSELSLRLMNLLRLAEVAGKLARHDTAKAALEEWLAVRDAACQQSPNLAKLEVLAKWDGWVRRKLSQPEQRSSS
jgi:hypothetical protein